MGRAKSKAPTLWARVLDGAEAVDARLAGVRGRVLLGAALACVLGGPVLDLWLEDTAEERASAALVVGFGVVLGGLVLGRVASWRDDRRQWSVPRVRARLRHLTALRLRMLRRWWAARWSTKALAVGPVMVQGGVVLLAGTKLSQLVRVTVRQVLGPLVHRVPDLRPLFREEVVPRLNTVRRLEGDLQALSVGLLVLGGGLAALGWLLRRRHLRGLRKSRVTGALPPVFAHHDAKAERVVVDHTVDPILHDTLAALRAWRPRTQTSEWAYQEDLERWLTERLAGHTVQTEQRIGSRKDGTFGRADVVVDGWLLIELKRGLTSGEGQRAVGQLDQYLRAWAGRGAVLLVLCDVPLQRAKAVFEPPVSRHHARGHVALVLTVQGR